MQMGDLTMIRRTLILGASYGSLFSTKLLMAVHDVTLVCRSATADLINARGTEVLLPLKGASSPRRIWSKELSGRLDAKTPEMVDPSDYDFVVLAMAGATVPAPRGACAFERDRRRAGAVSFADEHATAPVSKAHPGD